MLKLNDKTGKLIISSLGIKLSQDSTQEELERAVKHRPELLGRFIVETNKPETNGAKRTNKENAD